MDGRQYHSISFFAISKSNVHCTLTDTNIMTARSIHCDFCIYFLQLVVLNLKLPRNITRRNNIYSTTKCYEESKLGHLGWRQKGVEIEEDSDIGSRRENTYMNMLRSLGEGINFRKGYKPDTC